MIIAHVAKGDDEKHKRSIFGSVFFSNLARSTFELQTVQEPENNVRFLGLYNRKANETGLLRPLGFRMEITNEDVTIDATDLAEVPTLGKSLPLRQRITGALKTGRKTIQTLAEQLDEDPAQIRARLNGGRDKWSIKHPDETWGLLLRNS